MVAAWAAVRHDGVQESGALPEGVRDNYMAEMAAQLSVAAHAGVRRVVIIFDATSPPEVLRRFVWSCRRKRQRVYRGTGSIHGGGNCKRLRWLCLCGRRRT